MTTSRQRLDVQGLRALALIIIFFYHARFDLPGGFVALDVFFVISGYVITLVLQREWEKRGRISFRNFYVRRFRRLVPALALTVGIVVIVSIFLQSPFGAQQTTAATAAGAMLFSANLVIAVTTGDYFDAAADTNPLLNTWSLSAEEQFYFVFPALMVLGWIIVRRTGRKWALAGVLIALFAASFVFAVVTTRNPVEGPWLLVTGYYGSVGRAWEFAAGALLALADPRVRTWGRGWGELLAWGGFGLVVIGMFTVTSATPYPGVATLLPVLGTVGMIAGGTASERTSFSRLMSVRPLVRIGDMSYSWYLWHWPLIVFALILVPSRPFLGPIVAVLVSFIPAWLSYRFVETPLRAVKNPAPRRNAQLAIASFGIPLGLAGMLALGANAAWGQTWPRSYDYRESLSYAPGCHDGATDPGTCTWNAEAKSGTIALVGDSQALSLSDAALAAGITLDKRVFINSASQCPFARAGSVAFEYQNETCAQWQATMLDRLIELRPDAVLIANRPYFDGRTGGVNLVDASGGVIATGPASRAAWQQAVEDVVEPLERVGIPVVLVGPVPEPAYAVPGNGLLHLGRARATRAEAEEQASAVQAIDRAIAQAYPNVSLVDPIPVLCDANACADAADGEYLYADPRHLSPAGAERVAPLLIEALRQVDRKAPGS